MNTEGHHKRRYVERRDPLLTNPHKGCATFQRFAGDPLNDGTRWSEEGPLSFPAADREVAEGYLPSPVSYCRWFWEVFEPEEGSIDWSVVEGALATAAARGQTLQVRLMPHGSQKQPQLPGWYRDKYPTREGGKKRGQSYVEAIYDGPEYLETWGRVIADFGERFDGHPTLESVDIAFIGPWGEGAGEISEAQVERFVDRYAVAHPVTPLLINTDGYQFPCGIRKGAGWRCDCFGDLGFFGRKWNHTYDFYPMAAVKAGAQDRWQTRPVTFETCGVPASWKEQDFDLDFILRQGYKFHCSVFMPKSNPIPEEYVDPLAAFCDRIGYRFVLRQTTWERKVARGGRMGLTMWIENTGVAPIYRPYQLALRVQAGEADLVLPLGVDAQDWQPGDAWIEKALRLPDSLTGTARLAVGLVHPDTQEPRVRFAVEETDDQGWVPVGETEIG
ncbi:DUF4832 domain-containing protein [Candidatus Latescibacterota bacterium]